MDRAADSGGTYEAAAPPRRRLGALTLMLLVLGALAAGGAAGATGLFASVYRMALATGRPAAAADPVFLTLPEFIVVVGALSDYRASPRAEFGRHLRAVVQLEVEADRRARVEALQPRIIDSLLAFLHALDERDLASIRSLDRLKAQMLHRVRQVAGEDAVRGVLITDLAVM